MGCGLYGSAVMRNLLTFVSFCDKNTGVGAICSAGYSPENTVILSYFSFNFNIVSFA